ncbi:MAG: metallophosphoesterase [Thermoprotei archaeon]|nr:metallophosphoesterase [Thermoprotei archaeon]
MTEVVILALSDIHGNLYNVRRLASRRETADLILISGDITDFGSLDEAKAVLTILSEITESILYVPGNCDPPQLLEKGVPGYEAGWLHGRVIRYDNLLIGGLGGGGLSPFGTPIELTEEEFEEYAVRISNSWREMKQEKDIRILLSHMPPLRTKLSLTYSGDDIGSSSIRNLIEENLVELCLCGHLHERRGIDTMGRCLLINPGPLGYGFYAKVKIVAGEIKVDFKEV